MANRNIYIVNNAVNNMINKVINALEKNNEGLTITELVKITKLTKCQVRTELAFLLGAKEIKERQIGMAKLYTLK